MSPRPTSKVDGVHGVAPIGEVADEIKKRLPQALVVGIHGGLNTGQEDAGLLLEVGRAVRIAGVRQEHPHQHGSSGSHRACCRPYVDLGYRPAAGILLTERTPGHLCDREVDLCQAFAFLGDHVCRSWLSVGADALGVSLFTMSLMKRMIFGGNTHAPSLNLRSSVFANNLQARQ